MQVGCKRLCRSPNRNRPRSSSSTSKMDRTELEGHDRTWTTRAVATSKVAEEEVVKVGRRLSLDTSTVDMPEQNLQELHLPAFIHMYTYWPE